MPELPEIEAIRRYLVSRDLVGATIDTISGDATQVQISVEPRCVSMASVRAVNRRGKYLVLPISPSDPTCPHDMRIVMHMSMTGSLHVIPPRQLEPVPTLRHIRATIRLADSTRIVLNDPRRWARIWVATNIGSGISRGARIDALEPVTLPVDALGPDPADLTPSDFAQRLRPRRARIKAALLDQRLIAGIGNIYADEALHVAGISPNRRCCNVSLDRLQRLHEATVAVLERAVQHIVANPAPDGSPYVVNAHDGRFRLPRAVAATPADAAESADEDGAGAATAATPCPRCGPAQPLSSRRIVGRTTVYCARCQR